MDVENEDEEQLSSRGASTSASAQPPVQAQTQDTVCNFSLHTEFKSQGLIKYLKSYQLGCQILHTSVQVLQVGVHLSQLPIHRMLTVRYRPSF